MLKLISTLLALFPLLLFCQSSSWMELNVDCQEGNYYVQYISDHNHMIIGIPGVNESYITTDNGQSFQPFPWTWARFIVEIQSEENNDDFYFTDGEVIYRYDKNSATAAVVHDHSTYGYVDAGVILNNGERIIIYQESGKMMIERFDSGGQLQAANMLSDNRAKVELLYQDGYPAYITKSTYGQVVKTMMSLDIDDLSLGNEFVIDAHSTGMKYLDGRLFSSNEYSDDGGLTWTEISVPANIRWGNSIDILDNQVVIMSSTHLLHSSDGGQSFTAKPHNLDDLSSFYDVAFDKNGQRLMLFNSSELDNLMYSDNLGTSWSEYDNSLSLPITTRIAALQNDHLMANTINCSSRYMADNEWNDISIEDNTHIWDFKGLENGNYAGINAGSIYLSDDNGANWEVVVPEFYESRISNKQGLVYVTGYSGVALSEDNGQNYTIYDMEDVPRIWGGRHFSDKTSLYYDDNLQLNIYNLVNGINESLDKTIDLGTIIDMETDWSGKGFYLLEYATAAQQDWVLLRCESPGASFEGQPIPVSPVGENHKLVTDQNGNVFIFNRDQILISQDQGDSWHDLTPEMTDLWLISDMTVSYDNYLYLSTIGTGILKFPCPLDNDFSECDEFLTGGSKEEITVQVYPNPFMNQVNIEMEEVKNFEVSIYDVNGLRIQTDKNKRKVELENFAPGVYFLEVFDEDADRKIWRKIVK